MNSIWLVRSTFPSKEQAMMIAGSLLEENLVACVNISEGSTAMYHWEGMIQQEQEVIMLAKTTKDFVQKVIAHIKASHAYQVPSILAWEAAVVDESFAKWVVDVTAA